MKIKTQQEIKDNYAKSVGYKNFNLLLWDCGIFEIEKHYENIIKLVAQQSLNNASENAKVLTKNLDTENELEVICWTNERNVKFSVSKSLITNPDNIPLTI